MYQAASGFNHFFPPGLGGTKFGKTDHIWQPYLVRPD